MGIGNNTSFGILAIPVWKPDKDASPYITTCLINRRAVTGIQNLPLPVSIVHTETAHEIRIISFRKATSSETQRLLRALAD